jgi:hypothetical protein
LKVKGLSIPEQEVYHYSVEALMQLLLQLTDDDKKAHKSPEEPKAIEQKDKEPERKPDPPKHDDEEKKDVSPNEKDSDKKYKKGDLLGSGSFGSVFKCKCLETHVLCLLGNICDEGN